MKRSGQIARKKALQRKVRIAKSGGRRAGMSRAQHKELEELHREIVMLRAGISPKTTASGSRGWFGPCEHCHVSRWLSVCHIEPKGQYPSVRYDPENAWAGCYRCHLHWWHKNPGEAHQWIRQKLGNTAVEMLHLRALGKHKIDYWAERLYLLAERDRARAQTGQPIAAPP